MGEPQVSDALKSLIERIAGRDRKRREATTTWAPDAAECPKEDEAYLREAIRKAPALGIDAREVEGMLLDYLLGAALSPHETEGLRILKQIEDAGCRSAAGVPHPEEESAPPRARYWTKQHCPNCGATGITFLSIARFAQETQTPAKTVGRRMNSGRYWQDRLGQLPWCSSCREKTPEGEGVERLVEGLPGFKMTDDEFRLIMEWVRDHLVRRCNLPKLELTRRSRLQSPQESRAWDLLLQGCSAVYMRACHKREFPTREEAEAVAQTAIDDFNKNPEQFRRPKGAAGFDELVRRLGLKQVL